ncbi:hypothetical protein CVT25_001213 [Psilocybe cyanescens]|uniref:Uncharacterized protein n=1 Tax=Psilocybe cyanescens TaxID=93625 RepID=A0A409XKB8_PSICY|nr:hypothetical protein CVT25_001213 [Psilocybe cyanescens]
MAPSYSYCLLVIFAQEQGPIFVPFGWNRVPATARVIASAAGTTTYGLIDGGFSPGPATLVQSASAASMFYVNSAAATPTTLSGVCNLVSPVAMCTLNVYETGGPLPNASGTPQPGTGSGGGSSGSVGTSTGTILTMTTLALGFCIGLAFIR